MNLLTVNIDSNLFRYRYLISKYWDNKSGFLVKECQFQIGRKEKEKRDVMIY